MSRLADETLLAWEDEGDTSASIREVISSRYVHMVGRSEQIAEVVNQVSDSLKEQVPDHIREKARQMARQELQRRLEELDMSASEAKGYGALLAATQAHMASLLDLLEREF